jgi:hypothetical protein
VASGFMLIDSSQKLLRAGLIFCFEFAGLEWLRRPSSTTFPLSPGPQLGTSHANAATWMKTPQYQRRFPAPNTRMRKPQRTQPRAIECQSNRVARSKSRTN